MTKVYVTGRFTAPVEVDLDHDPDDEDSYADICERAEELVFNGDFDMDNLDIDIEDSYF